ncbi:MAG: DUF4145 domain-containing protein [Chitinophagaceae bacterium]|jgi:hypothetical protein|nr:DUF4145 domain-containing protein [Chitinophagaceae bacterium]
MADDLSKLISCGHCSNISHMKIIGNVNDTYVYEDPEYGPHGEGGTIYSVLECPACKKINIVSYSWHDGIESDDEIDYDILFPQESNFPVGLPDNIASTLRAAEKIKTIDVNAYAILLRRLLELVCLDRKAKGLTLALMLKDLADKNEIPEKLVKVANGLKDFGNIGAHAGIGELSEKEIPIVRALTLAILEYIYSAPHLATLAETKLNAIKTKGKKP